MFCQVVKVLVLLATARQSWAVCRPHIRIEDNLDETANLGFCPDLAGWGDTVTFDDALQAHTCKSDNGPDCHFFPEQQSSGAWLLKGLQDNAGRCIEATTSGSVYSKTCSGSTMQDWVLTQHKATAPGVGKFSPAPFSYYIQLKSDLAKCLVVATGNPQKAGTMWKRTLSVQTCNNLSGDDTKYKVWTVDCNTPANEQTCPTVALPSICGQSAVTSSTSPLTQQTPNVVTSSTSPLPQQTPAAKAGSPLLASPPHVYPDKNGVTHVVLTVDVARVNLPGAGQFTTRAYHYEGNPVLPGPTIHLARGGKLSLTLANNLGANSIIDGGHNDYREINTTNIHTHGLHADPAIDSIFRNAPPGKQLHYDLPIIAEHYPGTHWYHAHHHGSSTLQLMGGLFGMLIVDSDASLPLPASLANLPEEVFVLHMVKFKTENTQDCDKSDGTKTHDFFKIFSFAELEIASHSHVRASEKLTNNRDDFLMVNGQYQPTLRLAPGEKKIIRSVFAAGAGHPNLLIDGYEGQANPCTIVLIAADGVYLDTPRPVPNLVFVPGTRLDWVVSCSVVGKYQISDAKPITTSTMFNGVVAFIEVSGASVQSADVPTSLVSITKPYYLKDQTNSNADSEHSINFSQVNPPKDQCEHVLGEGEDCEKIGPGFPCEYKPFEGERGIDAPSCATQPSAGGGGGQTQTTPSSGGGTIRARTTRVRTTRGQAVGGRRTNIGSCYPHVTTVGDVNLWAVNNGKGNEPHPLHIHVNHFQVMSFKGVEYKDFRTGETIIQKLEDWGIYLGEWRDSIPALYGKTMIKFKAHTFSGEIVMHCHMLPHEDRGLMSTFLIRPDANAPSVTTQKSETAGPVNTATTAPLPSSKPNIVIIQPDDLPFYWADSPAPLSTRTATPHLDQLRAESAVFTRAYAASVMCAPSRFALMTGRYPSRGIKAQTMTSTSDCEHSADNPNSHRVTDVKVRTSRLDSNDNVQNLPQTLKAAGYRTGIVGKWHLGIETTATTQWAESQYAVETQKAVVSGMTYADGFYATNMDMSKSELPFSHNMEWMTAKAIEFIKQQSTKPFFLYMNPTVPHSPLAQEALEKYTVRDTPAGKLSADPVSNMPSRADIILRAKKSPELQDRGYSTTWLDDSVGAVYDALKTQKVLESTVIIFLMDHGEADKGKLSEGGARIALWIRYPAHPMFAKGAYSALVSNVDVAPTLIEFATGKSAAQSGNPMDGVSLFSLASTASNPALATSSKASYAPEAFINNRVIFVESETDRAVVSHSFKYVVHDLETCTSNFQGGQGSRTPGGGTTSSTTTALYDLSQGDLTESTNVATVVSYAKQKQALAGLLECHLKGTAPSETASYAACSVATTALTPQGAGVTSGTASPSTSPLPPKTPTVSETAGPVNTATTAPLPSSKPTKKLTNAVSTATYMVSSVVAMMMSAAAAVLML